MHNNYKQLEMLKELGKDQFVLSIIDEIFTSTNTLEGVSAAQAICERLCKFKNSQSIVTTHYTELTDLERSSKQKFVNYRFGVKRAEGRIVFPYKIEKGISTEYIALELLKENQFDPEIVERAKERLRSLIKERVLSEERVEDEEKVEKSS
jgi:DNA mismatch repair ATPase MutS